MPINTLTEKTTGFCSSSAGIKLFHPKYPTDFLIPFEFFIVADHSACNKPDQLDQQKGHCFDPDIIAGDHDRGFFSPPMYTYSTM